MPDKKSHEEFNKQWSKVVAKAWFDDSFKQKLLKNPEVMLKEMGINTDVKFVIHENNEKTCHLVIPSKPVEKLSEESLNKIAAGKCVGGCGGTDSSACGCSIGG